MPRMLWVGSLCVSRVTNGDYLEWTYLFRLARDTGWASGRADSIFHTVGARVASHDLLHPSSRLILGS
jgi:hypothetical protein